MKLHRFIGEYDLSKKDVEILEPEIIKQIKDVLRMVKGDIVMLSDGQSNEAEVVLELISSNKITGVVNKMAKPADAKGSGVAKKVNLYLAILKKENFELAVQKAVECGVSKITPIITERTVKTGLNIPRLEKIILEASEQCGRSSVPALSPIFKFKDAVLDGSRFDERIIFHPGGVDFPTYRGVASVCIFIGPEGGFTEKEITLAKNSGYVVASLGPLTLRAETAAIVATYRAVHKI